LYPNAVGLIALDQASPVTSVPTTSSAAIRPARRVPIRRHTRRSLNARTAVSANPATSCATNTHAPPNSVNPPLSASSATSAAKLQSVPRGVTSQVSMGGGVGSRHALR
jgi:hypothetical protein